VNTAAKDAEIRAVVDELDTLIAQLRANVAALNAVLVPPAPADPNGQEAIRR